MLQLLLVFPLFISLAHSSFKVDFDVRQQQPPVLRLSKRLEPLVLANKQNIYTTDLRIGSKEENVTVFVDTGSSDLWVMGSSVQCFSVNDFHANRTESIPDVFDDVDAAYPCTANGTFNSDESKTYHGSWHEFVIGYTDGSAATGIWGRDDVKFGNTTIEDLRFAVAYQSSVSDGILGLGIPNGYDNFPVELRKQKYIKRAAYSVYLNSADATNGSILFGAIDHKKYEGTLTTVSLTQDKHFTINVTYQGDNYPILLDTGSTFSILPDDWVREYAAALNGTYDSDELVYEIDCDSTGHAFDFSIGGVNFSIPVEDFIVEHNDKCYLGIMGNSVVGGGMLFGFDILRSMYLVYDIDGLTISVAPVIYTTDEDVQEFLHSYETEEELDPPASSSTSSSNGVNLFFQNFANWCHVALATIFFFL